MRRAVAQWPGALLLAALFAVVLGARLWLIDGYGTALPFLDQWDAEAALLLKPWLEGNLRFADLFQPHNEHRIVLSRLLVLTLTWLNGQWDSLLQMAINAMGYAVIALAVAFAATRLLGGKYRTIIFASTAVWATFPYSQENTLWGFQSSFYFLLFFSLVALWTLTLYQPFSIGWTVGIFSAVLACFSMGSGVIAPAAILCLLVLRCLRDRTVSRASLITASLCCAIIALAYSLRVEVPHHVSLRASSLSEWMHVLSRCLAWPLPDYPFVALVLYAPMGALAVAYFRPTDGVRTASAERRTEVLICVSLWVLLQAAAIAYARGSENQAQPASRYTDILALGTLCNLFAWLALIELNTANKRWKRYLIPAAVAWMVCVFVATAATSFLTLQEQTGRANYLRRAAMNLRGYVVTGDLQYLQNERPYPDVDRLASLLNDAAIRSVLPTAIREPLPIEKAVDMGTAFVPGGLPAGVANYGYGEVWGSFTGAGPNARGSMHSQEMQTSFPYLQIEIAGSLRTEMSLHVEAPETGKRVRFRPSRPVDAGWRAGVVATPSRSFRIVARDENDAGWFAFRQPREIALLSVYAQWLVERGKWLLLMGGSVWLMVVALEQVWSRRYQLSRRRQMHI